MPTLRTIYDYAEQLKTTRDSEVASLIHQMLDEYSPTSGLRRVQHGALTAILSRSSNIVDEHGRVLATEVFERLGVDEVVKRMSESKLPESKQAILLTGVLNSASKAGVSICSRVVTGMLDQPNRPLDLVMGGEPQIISMVLNAASKASEEAFTNFLDHYPQALEKVLREGRTKHIAAALDAASHANRDHLFQPMMEGVLDRLPEVIDKVMREGSAQEIAMTLNAATRAGEDVCARLVDIMMRHPEALDKVMNSRNTHAIATSFKAAASVSERCSESMMSEVVRNYPGAIDRVLDEGLTHRITYLCKAAAHAGIETCTAVMTKVMHHPRAVDAMLNEGDAGRFSNLLDAASRAENDISAAVMTKVLERRDLMGDLMGKGDPKHIGFLLAAAASAGREASTEVCSQLRGQHPGVLEAVVLRGPARHIADVLSAATAADERTRTEVTDLVWRDPEAVRKVMCEGAPGVITRALRAALHSAHPQAYCRQALEQWQQHYGADPDSLRSMNAFQATVWAQAVGASGMEGEVPGPPAMVKAVNGLNHLVGEFRAADAAYRKHTAPTDEQRIERQWDAREKLKALVEACRLPSEPGRENVVDLHGLDYDIARSVITRSVWANREGTLPTFIPGLGLHRRDGANPMADLVRTVCEEMGNPVSEDPRNPGRMKVEKHAPQKRHWTDVTAPAASYKHPRPERTAVQVASGQHYQHVLAEQGGASAGGAGTASGSAAPRATTRQGGAHSPQA